MNRKNESRARARVDRLLIKAKEKIASFRAQASRREVLSRYLGVFVEGGFYTLCGFLTSSGGLLFGAYPMGLALLCAADKYIWCVWAGCILSSLLTGKGGVVLAVVTTAVLAIRLRFSFYYKEQKRLSGSDGPVGLRVVLGIVASFFVGVSLCISERFSLHSLFALLFYMVAGGALVFAYSGEFMGVRAVPFYRKASRIALLASIVYGAGAFTFFTFSPSVALAVLICFLAAEKGDLLYSGALGLSLGLACGVSNIPVIGLTALVSGALYRYSSRTAPWLGILSGFGFAFYKNGSSAFLSTLPDLVSGLLIYIPVSALLQNNKNGFFEKKFSEKSASSPAALPAPGAEQSLEALSERLFTLSCKLRLPTEDDARRICKSGIEKGCASCKGGCFREDATKEALAQTLFETGRLAGSKAPDKVSSACYKWRDICESIDENYAEYLRRLCEADRCDAYARSYKSIAGLLRDKEDLAKENETRNPDAERAFGRALRKAMIECGSCSATGLRNTVLTAENVNVSHLTKTASELQTFFEKECMLCLSEPELECANGKSDLIFRRRECYSVKTGSAAKTKTGEEVCGDTLYTFASDRYFYALLCDGMGSGREAALVSKIACHFVEQFALASGTPKTVLRAVNDFLLCQTCECCTTMDLLQIDLYDGTGRFIKCGACPSLVLRDGNIFKLSSASIPVGAAREVNFEEVTLHLKAGDRVLMMSDGVAPDLESAPWLSPLLAGKLRSSPEELAEDILHFSESKTKKDDDRSVMVVDLIEAVK